MPPYQPVQLMLKRLLLDDRFILGVIFINAIVIFILGFSPENHLLAGLETLDHFFTLVFLAEALVKIRTWKASGYFSSWWNVFDFALVLLALPSLLLWLTPANASQLDFLLIFRVLRVFKFFRFVRFVPNIHHIFVGVGRAARASVLLVAVFFIFNFILSLVACFLFRDLAPEHFGNPFQSFYSMFKVFTIEGWFEIPDAISESSPPMISFAVRLFFMTIFFLGGVIGLSIVNSIFVDSMVSDNNDSLELKVDALQRKIDLLLEQRNAGANGDQEG